jgi:hypothetical protein
MRARFQEAGKEPEVWLYTVSLTQVLLYSVSLIAAICERCLPRQTRYPVDQADWREAGISFTEKSRGVSRAEIKVVVTRWMGEAMGSETKRVDCSPVHHVTQ